MNIVDRLWVSGNRNSTRQNYHCVWRLFNEFFIKLDNKPDSREDRLVLFVGYLINEKKKAATIRSYISAIKSVLKEDGFEINENKYLISSLTKACKYVNDKVRIRLPIHKSLLQIILRKIDDIFNDKGNQPYLATLYRTIISTAYYGLFRIGEVATGTHPVLARDVHIGTNKNKMLFILRTSKTHWSDVKPQTVKVTSNDIGKGPKTSDIICPFQLLREYLIVRQPFKGDYEPFFVFRDRTPVPAVIACKVLKNMLKQCGFDPALYSFHSLRAGRTGDLAKLQVPLSTIRQLGRWRTNTVYKYLKAC